MNSPPVWAVLAAYGMVIGFSAMNVQAQPPGYFPKPGVETACLNFAIDLYNRLSGRPKRAGPLAVASATMEALNYGTDHPTELWYRFLGTLLMDTQCPNTADNNGANPYVCPVVTDKMVDGSMPWNATCNFKVWSAPTLRPTDRFRMMYMMCY